MRPFQQISLILGERQLLTRFWQAASVFWRMQTGRAATLATFLIVVVLLQLLVQVALNVWNRHFFDALERKDAATVWSQAQLFVPLAAGSILLAAVSVWGRMFWTLRASRTPKPARVNLAARSLGGQLRARGLRIGGSTRLDAGQMKVWQMRDLSGLQ